jgi:hypothetical protein
MAGKRRAARADQEVAESLRGNRQLKPIMHLVERLHSVGIERGRPVAPEILVSAGWLVIIMLARAAGSAELGR